uniref:MATH domain-containing protein n=1 Tax=Oryza sativa subsp. japonica TaxID=39947 RepID=Q7XE73_ORYSJ|nr:hypothetical protein LOC_Os10g29830 [Oryza sativa Japonica Group]
MDGQRREEAGSGGAGGAGKRSWMAVAAPVARSLVHSASAAVKGSECGALVVVASAVVVADTTADIVSAKVTFSLLDQKGNPMPSHTLTTPLLKFSLYGTLPKTLGYNSWYNSFIRRDDLERSGHLKDDCFAIGVHVVVTKEAIPSSITVPPLQDN